MNGYFMKNNPTIAEYLIQDLPPGFVRQILETLPKIYREAYDSVTNDSRLGEPEALYLLGHTRRAIFETEFRKMALDCGLQVEMHKPKRGGCTHVRVLAGRFQLIACHVASPGAFPNHSDCREQYSAINEHLQQGQLFEESSSPGEQAFYGILTHTSDPKDASTFRSVQIGFPDTHFLEWAEEPVDLLDIRDKQSRMFRAAEDLQGQIQRPKPRWKQAQQEDPKPIFKKNNQGDND